MANISVYANPHASSVNYKYWETQLVKMFYRHNLNFKNPANLEELKIQVEQDKNQDCELVITIGGDGTVNAMIQNLIGSKIHLLPIAAGTANDFSTELNIPRRPDLLLNLYHSKSLKNVDVIKINDKYMLTNGGIGLASKVVDEINSLRLDSPLFKKLMSAAKSEIYSAFLLKNIFRIKLDYHQIAVHSPDLPSTSNIFKTPLVLISNQEDLGRNFKVAKGTRNDDGKFNVKIFTHQNIFSLIKDMILIRLGKNPDPKNVLSFETNKILLKELNSKKKLSFFGDGDILLSANEILVQVCETPQSVFYFDKALVKFQSYNLDEIEEV